MISLHLWSVTSALAGSQFGFDTVIISGAEQAVQLLCQLNARPHESAAAIGRAAG